MSAMDQQVQSERADQTEAVRKRIFMEPAYRRVFYKLLEYCRTSRTLEEAEEELLSYPEMAAALHSPSIVFHWMVQAGGICRLEPQGDEPVRWRTTEAGEAACKAEPARDALAQIYMTEPELQPIYLRVLEACREPKSRQDVESLLSDGRDPIPPDVYPSYFMDRLETAGAIEWQGGWRITELGRAHLH